VDVPIFLKAQELLMGIITHFGQNGDGGVSYIHPKLGFDLPPS